MGWLFTEGQTKADLIAHLTQCDSQLHTHRKCVRGTTLWAVQEHKDRPGEPFIVAYLMQHERGYGWGYKPVTESMGPAEVSCPVSYLDAVPIADGPHALEWRERVRRHHAAQKRKRRMLKDAAIGDRMTLVAGLSHHTLALVSKNPVLGRDDDGHLWRVPQRLIESVGPA